VLLSALTENKEKGWKGRTSFHDLTDKGAGWLHDTKLSRLNTDMALKIIEEFRAK
jgi:hypothetical protein